MLSDKHYKAQALSIEAANAKEEGRSEDALNLFAQAAEWEKAALDGVPPDKVRTRSILTVSVASLLYKAEMLEQAELAIFRFLSSNILENWAEQQLRELLVVVSDEKLLTQTFRRRYTGENITFVLRGGEIGSGTGPLDLILEKASGFRSLLYRFAEWIGNLPLRLQGNPPKEVMELVQARAAEPAPGSYRIEIRLTEPLQLELFELKKVRPKAVSDSMFQFLNCLTHKHNFNKLSELVPQEDYRKALLQLTRNVAPKGGRIREIGIYRDHEDRVQSIYLTEALPSRIKEVIPRKPKDSSDIEKEVQGVLRGLHLDKHWLVIRLPDGAEERCDTPPDMLDDVVGPMVNREVIVRGIKPAQRKHLLVEEIELAEED
jgi:hypothetical protein